METRSQSQRNNSSTNDVTETKKRKRTTTSAPTQEIPQEKVKKAKTVTPQKKTATETNNNSAKKQTKKRHDASLETYKKKKPRDEDQKKAKKYKNEKKEAPHGTYSRFVENKDDTQEFTERDWNFLTQNEYYRFLKSSDLVGHAVFLKNPEGKKIAYQFNIPSGVEGSPLVVPLKNIEEVVRYGVTGYKALTQDNKIMYGKRFNHATFQETIDNKVQETEIDIGYFSGTESGKEPFWGSKEKEVPFFNPELSKEDRAELEKELAETKKLKGDEETIIDPESVWKRDTMKRNPDQNTVMKGSAKEAYEAFLEAFEDELSKEFIEILERAIGADLKNLFWSNYRPEWLHGKGFSLTPTNQDPQTPENLGAAPKWTNTEMMVLERIAKWFAMNYPETYQIKIKPTFEMFFDSELIRKVDFEVSLTDGNKTITFAEHMNTFVKNHLFRKATDLAQLIPITQYLFNGVEPISEQEVKQAVGNTKFEPNRKNSQAQTTEHPKFSFFGDSKGELKLNKKNGVNENNNAIIVDESNTDNMPIDEKNDGYIPNISNIKKVRNKFPTATDYDKSVVEIKTTYFTSDYTNLPAPPLTSKCTGSGFVITVNGEKFIMTNAHVAENAREMLVRFANNDVQYETEIVCVGYQCDLALLRVKDPAFNKIAVPLEFGDMVQVTDEVHVIGFPMGGHEVSVTKGTISRIEVGGYVQSDHQDMLQAQTDTAVNPGNSGGPVVKDGKVVGIAFQGANRQGMSYVIVCPIAKRFLQEVQTGEFKGFPILPIEFESIKNKTLKQHYGMGENTGIKIKKVAPLSDAHKKLKPNDVLLEIDGKKVSNRGQVNIEGIGNNIDLVHVTHSKMLGETVKLKILRKNENTQKMEPLNVEVVLDRVPRESYKVGPREFDKLPTYFYNSGMGFTYLTPNYMDEAENDDLDPEGPLKDVFKEKLGQQIVIINDVLECEETRDYGKYQDKPVLKINGKDIDNLQDALKALEENKEPVHEILVGKKENPDQIVIENMSSEKHNKLLHLNGLRTDRSIDLQPGVVNDFIIKPVGLVPRKEAAKKPVLAKKSATYSNSGMEFSYESNKFKKPQVVISNVSKSEDTEGYDQFIGQPIISINNKEINNLKDVMAALEDNKEEVHVILAGNKRKPTEILLKNTPNENNSQMLDAEPIISDQSHTQVASISLGKRKQTAAEINNNHNPEEDLNNPFKKPRRQKLHESKESDVIKTSKMDPIEEANTLTRIKKNQALQTAQLEEAKQGKRKFIPPEELDDYFTQTKPVSAGHKGFLDLVADLEDQYGGENNNEYLSEEDQDFIVNDEEDEIEEFSDSEKSTESDDNDIEINDQFTSENEKEVKKDNKKEAEEVINEGKQEVGVENKAKSNLTSFSLFKRLRKHPEVPKQAEEEKASNKRKQIDEQVEEPAWKKRRRHS